MTAFVTLRTPSKTASDHIMKILRTSSFAFVLSLAVTWPLAAQERQQPDTTGTRTIDQEILAQPEPDVVRLAKARTILLRTLLTGDVAGARAALQYLDERFDTAYVIPLYPGERMLAAYWIGDYGPILRMASAPEANYVNRIDKMLPYTDLLYRRLHERSIPWRRMLEDQVRRSGNAEEERELLLLVLHDILASGDDPSAFSSTAQDSINREADEFLAVHGDSKYAPFVRSQIRYVVQPSPWGFGYNFAVGYLAVPSRLRVFGDYVDFAFGLEGSLFEWYAELRVDIGAARKTAGEFTYNGLWPSGTNVMEAGGVVSLGRIFPAGDLFTLIPHLSIGGLDFAPTQEETDRLGKDYALDFAVWGIGMHVDLGLGGDIHLRLSAETRFPLEHRNVAGSEFTFITVGIGTFGHSIVRDN
jgi:hypothetical protein